MSISLKNLKRHIVKHQHSPIFSKFAVKMNVSNVLVDHTVMVLQAGKPIVMLEIIVKMDLIQMVLQFVQLVMNVQMDLRIHARLEHIKMSLIK